MPNVSQTKNIGAYINEALSTSPANQTAATVNGASVDRKGSYSCVLAASCGAASGTPTAQTYDAKLQESADGSTGWVDIAGAAITQIVADSTNGRIAVDLSGALRYIRIVRTVGFTGGTAPALPVSEALVLGGDDSLAAS